MTEPPLFISCMLHLCVHFMKKFLKSAIIGHFNL